MTNGERFSKGIQIILKYEKDAEYAAEHDVVWFGAFRPEKMSALDRRLLSDCGWEYDKEFDSWRKFV